MRLPLTVLLLVASGCTWHHSRQALGPDYSTTPADKATFVSEEDSGLTLFRVATLSEPDHYAVLIERMRKRYRCAAIHHLQLDLYTDDWLILEFPIARLTAICDREKGSPRKGKKPEGKTREGASKNAKVEEGAGDAPAPAQADETRRPAEKNETPEPETDRENEQGLSGDADTDEQT